MSAVVTARPSTTDLPFPDALSELLSPRTTLPSDRSSPHGEGSEQVTLNALAARIGVAQSHLWRVVNRPSERRPSLDLIASVARALELPDDYFLETRAVFVDTYLRNHPTRLNQIYEEARRSRPRSR